VRVALANTLHDLFLYAAIILLFAMAASVFLRDVPLLAQRRQSEPEVGGHAQAEAADGPVHTA